MSHRKELARQRRELPWVRVEKQYPLQTEEGARALAELFDGRSQLVVYHFMFGPGYSAGCPACSSTADGFNGVLAHLQARDVTMVRVSRAPLDKLLAYRERMGWSFTWASSFGSDFNVDFGVSAGEAVTGGPAAPRPESFGLALLRLLQDRPAVRENLPLVTAQNARATGTDLEGCFSEGHGLTARAQLWPKLVVEWPKPAAWSLTSAQPGHDQAAVSGVPADPPGLTRDENPACAWPPRQRA